MGGVYQRGVGPKRQGRQLKAAFDGEGKTPWLWQTARYCLDLPQRNITFLHFPRGTYYQQISTAAGRKELELIESLWNYAKALSRMEQGDTSKKEFDQQLLSTIGVELPPGV